MTLRLTSLTVALIVSFSGCFLDDPFTCDTSNCTGCCSADGVCQAGIVANACGVGGNLCDVCIGAQVCSAGRCAFSGGTGGGGGGVVTGGGGGTTGGGGGTTGGGGGGMTGTNAISGTATYEFVRSFYDPVADTGTLLFGQSTTKPIRNAVVRVLQGSTALATGVTGEDGRYALSYTPSGSTPVQVVVVSRTTNPEIQVEDNTDNNLAWAIGGTIATGATTMDLHAPAGWTGSGYDPARRLAAPFAVLDSMLTASRAFMAVRNVNFPPLKVNWSPNNAPQAGDKTQGLIGTSHFSPAENEIYVLGKAGADTDEFDSHVIVHEWGHFFEANLARSDSPGGRHGPGDVLDPRIAFGEAWGNAVASMVLPEVVYSDTTWSGATLYAFGFDTETEPTPTDDPTPSGFSESSVLRVLFDLYDSNVDGPFDQVATGLGPIYDVLTGPQRSTQAVTTLASFITGLKAQPGVNATAINTLLARYNIGPIVSDFGDGDPLLRDMFTNAASLPFTGSIALGGGNPPNSWQQNQYYVFTGTGGRVTVSATSSQDVAIVAYLRGVEAGFADSNTSGTESFNFVTQSGAKYVVVLTGFGQVMSDYNVTLNITSP